MSILKCRLNSRFLVELDSFTDFERALRPHLKVFGATVLLVEGARSREGSGGVLGLLEAQVALTEGFVLLFLTVTGLSYELEAVQSDVAINLARLVIGDFIFLFNLKRGVGSVDGELVLGFGSVWSVAGFGKDVGVGGAHGGEVGLVEVSMNFLEASVLVAEMATFAIWTELLPVELSAILGLVLLVEAGLSLSDPVDLGELVVSVSVLALVTVPAEAHFSPVLAHLPFVLLSVQGLKLPIQVEMDGVVLVVTHMALTHVGCGAESWLECGFSSLGVREWV